MRRRIRCDGITKTWAPGERAGHKFVFKCKWCKTWVCGTCEGTHDANDPVGNRLCDPCWARRAKRLKPAYAKSVGIL